MTLFQKTCGPQSQARNKLSNRSPRTLANANQDGAADKRFYSILDRAYVPIKDFLV